jgi:ribosomal protein S27AE
VFRVLIGRRPGRFFTWRDWRTKPIAFDDEWRPCGLCGAQGIMYDQRDGVLYRVYCGNCLGVGSTYYVTV